MNVPPEPRAVASWAQSGVIGCIADVASLDEIVSAVKSVLRSEVICSPSLAGILFARAHRTDGATPMSPHLYGDHWLLGV